MNQAVDSGLLRRGFDLWVLLYSSINLHLGGDPRRQQQQSTDKLFLRKESECYGKVDFSVVRHATVPSEYENHTARNHAQTLTR